MTNTANEQVAFDAMRFTVAQPGGGLPPGNYTGKFAGAAYLPEEAADPMTGEGGRKWPKVAFRWELLGEHAGKSAVRETPASQGARSAFVQVAGWVMGKPLQPGEAVNLTPFVGRKYLLTVGSKVGKDGVPTNWTHVVNAMLAPA